MKFSDLIQKKKLNQELNLHEIEYIVNNYSNNKITDQEMIKLIDCFIKNDMTEQETILFFDETYKKAKKIDLSMVDGFKIDKHSTGGVGDKITLILMPMLDALGLKSFKLSGGRLGFTGGTIEKLNSFPNIQLKISPKQFTKLAKKNNILISYNDDEISYFEKKLYHLRNITKKTNVLGMIVNSVMIKKIIFNNNGLIIDVKTGSGTFFKTFAKGLKFAKMASQIAKKYERKVSFIITNMNEPLGQNIGNKLEIIEVMDYLENKQNNLQDLVKIVNTHIHEALMMSQKSNNVGETKNKINEVIKSGLALKKFRNWIEKQGGNFDAIYQNRKTQTKNKIEIRSWKKGYLNIIDTSKIGLLVNEISINNKKINYETGIQLWKKNGIFIKENELIATIWTNHSNTKTIEAKFKKLINISEKIKVQEKLIKKIIRYF